MSNSEPLNQLALFFSEWNSRFNLSSIRNIEEIKSKHIQDSLKILETQIELNNKKILDIGSGGGFPGIPLAIKLKNSEITMVESIQKKCNYLEAASHKFKLKNSKIICSRIEELPQLPQYDIVTARAFAYMPIILETSFKLLKKGGYFMLFKGTKNLTEELADTQGFITKYQLLKLKDFDYTINDSHRKIIILQKTKDFEDYKARSFKKLKKTYRKNTK